MKSLVILALTLIPACGLLTPTGSDHVGDRCGGSVLGGTNRTVDALDGQRFDYCAAFPDLEASLDYARRMHHDGPLIVWGSSYSGALALRLASENADAVGGVHGSSMLNAQRVGADVEATWQVVLAFLDDVATGTDPRGDARPSSPRTQS